MTQVVKKAAVAGFTDLLGIPPGASRLIISPLDELRVQVTAFYPESYVLKPGTIDGICSVHMNADHTKLVIVLKPQLATYRDIRCMLAGVQ